MKEVHMFKVTLILLALMIQACGKAPQNCQMKTITLIDYCAHYNNGKGPFDGDYIACKAHFDGNYFSAMKQDTHQVGESVQVCGDAIDSQYPNI